MTSNLEDIGFLVRDARDFTALALQAMKRGEVIKIKNSTCDYRCWKVGNGIELWVASEDDKIACFSPFFASSHTHKLRVVRRATGERCEFCMDYFAVLPEEAGESGPPVVFSVPNAKLLELDGLPSNQSVELCAFATDVNLYLSKDEFKHSQMGANWVAGYYLANNRDEEHPKTRLGGHVKDVETIRNPVSGTKFYRLVIDNATLGDLVVVAGKRSFLDDPHRHNVIEGEFSLMGKIL